MLLKKTPLKVLGNVLEKSRGDFHFTEKLFTNMNNFNQKTTDLMSISDETEVVYIGAYKLSINYNTCYELLFRDILEGHI